MSADYTDFEIDEILADMGYSDARQRVESARRAEAAEKARMAPLSADELKEAQAARFLGMELSERERRGVELADRREAETPTAEEIAELSMFVDKQGMFFSARDGRPAEVLFGASAVLRSITNLGLAGTRAFLGAGKRGAAS